MKKVIHLTCTPNEGGKTATIVATSSENSGVEISCSGSVVIPIPAVGSDTQQKNARKLIERLAAGDKKLVEKTYNDLDNLLSKKGM